MNERFINKEEVNIYEQYQLCEEYFLFHAEWSFGLFSVPVSIDFSIKCVGRSMILLLRWLSLKSHENHGVVDKVSSASERRYRWVEHLGALSGEVECDDSPSLLESD